MFRIEVEQGVVIEIDDSPFPAELHNCLVHTDLQRHCRRSEATCLRCCCFDPPIADERRLRYAATLMQCSDTRHR